MDAEAIMDVVYMDAYGLIALNRLVSVIIVKTEEKTAEPKLNLGRKTNERVLSTVLLLSFILTLILLYIHPIPP